MEKQRKYILITGLRRSGTTMLANFLNAQANMTVFRDFGLFMKRLARWPYDPTESFDEQLRNIIISNAKAEALSYGQIDLKIDPKEASNTYDVLKILLDPIAHHDDRIVGSKVTEALPLLCKLLPYPCFTGIYVRRDIRSVIHSGKNRFFDYDVDAQISLWQQEMREVERLQQQYKNFIVVRYEDFVCGKNDEILSKCLGQTIDRNIKALKDRNGSGEQWRGNTSFGEIEPHELCGIYSTNMRKWVEKIQHDVDLQYADHVCRNILEPEERSQMRYPLAKRLQFYWRNRRRAYSMAFRGFVRQLLRRRSR